jgi:hypothetical protein
MDTFQIDKNLHDSVFLQKYVIGEIEHHTRQATKDA